MDIIIGNNSFNVQTLKSVSKEEAIKSFKEIDSGVVERAWIDANPTVTKRRRRKKAKD